MGAKPYMTSDDLIASVKRKISFPVSQQTFTNLDILAFANEEMFLAQVLSVLQFHQEYFVTYKQVPLQTNLSRYPIPNRATGMKLRDLFWMDQNGNLFEMTRVDEHDRAFFQRNVGANQAVHKFFVQGNDVILTPGVVDSPTGSLIFVFFLRPNQLVKNDRAAIVNNFVQTIKINSSLIAPLDIINIGVVENVYNQVGNNLIIQTSLTSIPIGNPGPTPFTAVNSLGGTISAVTQYSGSNTVTQITTSTPHQLNTNQTVVISGSNSNPVADGIYVVQVVDPNNFIIPLSISTAGTTGAFTSPNQFLIDASDSITASNLAAAINITEINTDMTAVAAGNLITTSFDNIQTTFQSLNLTGFVVPTQTLGINFQSLSATYTDQETNITDTLFVNGGLVDLLETLPGHRTYVYDVQIPRNGISGTTVTFPVSSILVPTETVNNGAGPPGTPISANVQLVIANIQVGDYMCVANEAIIPQIPPDLHNGLAERTAARILAALGDQQGLQASMTKIQEIESRQGNILDNRSEGTPIKVVNRHSMLRY